jgi:hypothetical protein
MVRMPSKRHTHTIVPYIFHLPRFYGVNKANVKGLAVAVHTV